MSVVNHRLLFDHSDPPHLSLSYDSGQPVRPWAIRDRERDQLYARASTLPQAESFLRASERKGDATVDWPSVQRQYAISASLEFAAVLLAGSGTEPTAVEATHKPPVPLADDDEPASVPDTFSRRVTADVIPLPLKGA